MTDALLTFATDYGLYVVLIELFICTLVAYALGDQTAYQLGKYAGPSLFERLGNYKRLAPVIDKSEQIYQKHGVFAILLTRTVVSPCGPYIAYTCGAWSMSRLQYTSAAILGSFLWTTAYIMVGYTFAGDVPEISRLMRSAMMVGLALLFAIGFGIKLALSWKEFKSQLV